MKNPEKKRKRRAAVLAALLAAALLLGGCAGGGREEYERFDELFVQTQASLEEGHFFFSGRVLSVVTGRQIISYYEAQMEKNTFYQVEVTDDYFGCMPDRIITVCVLGSAENFSDRETLVKNREYLFDTALWIQEEEAVFLLPTFYSALPEQRDGTLYLNDAEGAYIPGTYAQYRSRLAALAEEAGYGPQRIMEAVRAQLQSAADKSSADYFAQRGFEQIDADALERTRQTALQLYDQAQGTENTWEGIRSLLQ